MTCVYQEPPTVRAGYRRCDGTRRRRQELQLAATPGHQAHLGHIDMTSATSTLTPLASPGQPRASSVAAARSAAATTTYPVSTEVAGSPPSAAGTVACPVPMRLPRSTTDSPIRPNHAPHASSSPATAL